MNVSHRAVMRNLLGVSYLVAGVLHIATPERFLPIMPDIVPWPKATVMATGFCEIAGALGLTIPNLRRAAGIALAVYAVCVFPANLKHAFYMVPVPVLPESWWYHGPRLALQPVIVWWALYAARMTDWPFAGKHRA